LQEQRPLDDPLVFGNYNVAYVSAGPKQYGQPVGGRFRGTLGKLLFRTTFLGQSVLQPNIVTNKVAWERAVRGGRHQLLGRDAGKRAAGQHTPVPASRPPPLGHPWPSMAVAPACQRAAPPRCPQVAFRLLGFLPGSVGLRGTFVGIPEEQGGEDRRDTVKVFFDPPVLSLPAGIHVRQGEGGGPAALGMGFWMEVNVRRGWAGSLGTWQGRLAANGLRLTLLHLPAGSGPPAAWC
jgi:hypothetical protein